MIRYRATIHLQDIQDFHCTKVATGLVELQKRGRITVRYALEPRTEPVLLMSVEDTETGASKRLVFDLVDHSNRFYNRALQWCDVYFKRSYFPQDLALADPANAGKVVPFGLNYACANPKVRRDLILRLGWMAVRSRPKSRTEIMQSITKLRIIANQPDWHEFEWSSGMQRTETALFQTRIWPPEDSTEDLDRINEERVTLIRALKAGLGDRFKGGIVPSEEARRRWPDLLANQPHRRREYTRVAKKSRIGVYSIGLHKSTAFKLPEYLAAGQCIVSDHIHNRCPVDLVPGVNYLEYSSPEECVEHCKKLLMDKALADRMSRENLAYYQKYVAPEPHIWDCLERAFKHNAKELESAKA